MAQVPALTTTFTQPPACLSSGITIHPSEISNTITYFAAAYSTDRTECFPPGWRQEIGIATGLIPGYYAPGVCPKDWKSACTRVYERDGGKKVTPTVCCPQAYTCPSFGPYCVSQITTPPIAAATYVGRDGSEYFIAPDAVRSYVTEVDLIGVLIAPTDTGEKNEPALKTGEIIGIVVGVVGAVLTGIGAYFAWKAINDNKTNNP